MGRFAAKKRSRFTKSCSAVDLIFTSRILFRFRLHVRFMHKAESD